MEVKTKNNLVRYSRAGDEFHYRWAARRCLNMIYPKSKVVKLIVEGSDKPNSPGELVIDVSEYLGEIDNIQKINFYQLKHTTVRKSKPFTLSELKKTIEAFASRYRDATKVNEEIIPLYFYLITNRPVSKTLKNKIELLVNHKKIDKSTKATLESYTKLKGVKLLNFFNSFIIVDNEGGYKEQEYELRKELSYLYAGTIDNRDIENVIGLVRRKVFPERENKREKGRILKAEVLQCISNVESENILFPAPPEYERFENVFLREQHEELLEKINNSDKPIILEAGAGVGKSVIANQLAKSLPNGSLGIVYDCFGGGKYTRQSQIRHRHKEALVQISNEIAQYQLCAPLIGGNADPKQLLQHFIRRLNDAITLLRTNNADAILVVFIDAADNSVMAAEKFGDRSFVLDLLEEKYPEGCKIVMLCRPERKKLLKPNDNILKLYLKPFTERETERHLKRKYPKVSDKDIKEFHKLTNNGNPRVQANVLSYGNSFKDVLTHLGPTGQTVQGQIESLLSTAINIIKEQRPTKYRKEVNTICTGLATLPPFIPIEILAYTAKVDINTVKSFLNEMGRSFLITDNNAIQFRDEPTETWFRKKFVAKKSDIVSYIKVLEPFAKKSIYVAETLPFLLLQAGRYNEVINLALNNKYLPEDSPIDKRNIKLFRLQFAFKAALKKRKYVDAVKLAMLNGEEFAGDQRQLNLLQKNIDLIEPLQSEQRVQELAFKGVLRGEWKGSKNLYSASLFATVNNFEGESRSYLRAAYERMFLYFENRKDETENHYPQINFEDDFVEFAYAHYNLDGIKSSVNFLTRIKPDDTVFKVTRKFVRRLIDHGKLKSIAEILNVDVITPYIVLATIHESLDAGLILSSNKIDKLLVKLVNKKNEITIHRDFNENLPLSAILSFLEVCASNKKSKVKILQVLKQYSSLRTNRLFTGELFEKNERKYYLRTVALITILGNKDKPSVNSLLPKEYTTEKRKNYDLENKIKEFEQVVNALLPWYILRLKVVVGDVKNLSELLISTQRKSNEALVHRWRENDSLKHEIASVFVDILSLVKNKSKTQIYSIYKQFFNQEKKIWLEDHFKLLRNSSRLKHLKDIRSLEEIAIRGIVEASKDEEPETTANWYVELARATLNLDKNDSAIYFNLALDAVSKFGDEIVQRWKAISALATKASENSIPSNKLSYRYIRCAEQVGETVGREKYWERNKAIEICCKLSPQVGLSSLSRWRDRNIGWFNEQIIYLAQVLVEDKRISPETGWALTPFFREYGITDFACLCIEKSSSQNIKKYILNSAIHQLQLNEGSYEDWVKLKGKAEKKSLEYRKILDILEFYENNPGLVDENSNSDFIINKEKPRKAPNWRAIFQDLDLTVEDGIVEALKRFNELSDIYAYRNDFWVQLTWRVSEHDIIKYLKSLITSADIDDYDVKDALSNIPELWYQKINFQHNLPQIYKILAERFFLNYLTPQYSNHFFKNITISQDYSAEIKNGIVEGFIIHAEHLDADSYFRFVEIASDFISPKQALNLLDFALKRFEIHIDRDFADGQWSEWLKPPNNIIDAYTGLIWSALGSPVAKVRWQAVHSVRRLCEMNCTKEVSALVKWMNKDTQDAFGNIKFPFYNLHSRLYLLIAFSRVSIDLPEILLPFANIFMKMALNNIPHILIQKFSSDIALNIEKKFPKIFSDNIICKLKDVNVSQLPIKNSKDIVNSQYNPFDSGESFNRRKFYIELDFPKYWFNSLSILFDISINEINELVENLIVDDWKIEGDGSYKNDPRHYLWRYERDEFNINHSHGTYPSTDSYSFYLSYHAMFVVANLLLKKFPIVKEDDIYGYSWDEWIQRHSLTRSDGRWLADRRDPAPLYKKELDRNIDLDKWLSGINDYDFLKSIIFIKNNETWLRVYGEWSEGDEYRWYEDIDISSALVSKEYSQSLLNALSTYKSSYDVFLSHYESSNDHEYSPFIINEWIEHNYLEHRLDQYDPFANGIKYPPLIIKKEISEKLGLESDNEKRSWYRKSEKETEVTSEVWASNPARYDKGPLRYGQCLSISINLLQTLCLEYDSDLILVIKIKRNKKENSRVRISNEYKQPKHKIFIFSKNGKLRDTEKYYHIR